MSHSWKLQERREPGGSRATLLAITEACSVPSNHRPDHCRTQRRTDLPYIPTGRFPTGVAFSPDGGAAYVASQDHSVTVIDVASGKSSGTLRLDVDAFAVLVSPDGTQLYVGTVSAALFTIDLVTRTLIRSIDVGVAPNAFAVSPDKPLLYVSSFVDGSVAEIGMASGATRRTFAVGGMPQGMAPNRKGSRLYVGTSVTSFDRARLAAHPT